MEPLIIQFMEVGSVIVDTITMFIDGVKLSKNRPEETVIIRIFNVHAAKLVSDAAGRGNVRGRRNWTVWSGEEAKTINLYWQPLRAPAIKIFYG